MLPALPTGIAVHARAVAEHVDDLEGGRLLALDAGRVDRVHDLDAGPLAELAHDSRGPRRSCRGPGRPCAPWISACASFPSAIWPAGSTTAQTSPARAAYAAADADVFPVDAQTTALAPCSAAFDTATVIPRSLNEPVGLAPSILSQTRATPAWAARRGVASSGVLPSRSVTTGVASLTGSSDAEGLDEPRPGLRHPTSPITRSTDPTRWTRASTPRSSARRWRAGRLSGAAVGHEDQPGVRAEAALLHRLDRHAVVARTRRRSQRARPDGRRPRRAGRTATRGRRSVARRDAAAPPDGGALRAGHEVVGRVDEVAEHRARRSGPPPAPRP